LHTTIVGRYGWPTVSAGESAIKWTTLFYRYHFNITLTSNRNNRFYRCCL